MAELTTSAGLPYLEIEDAGGCVTVCFRHGQFVPSQTSGSDVIERHEAILALFDRADDGLALREIRAQLNSSCQRTSDQKGFGGVEERWAGAVHWPRSSGPLETHSKPVEVNETPCEPRGLIGVLFPSHPRRTRTWRASQRCVAVSHRS